MNRYFSEPKMTAFIVALSIMNGGITAFTDSSAGAFVSLFAIVALFTQDWPKDSIPEAVREAFSE